MEFFLPAILLGLSVAAPIGPVNLEIMRRGLAGGFRPAFFVGLGASTIDGAYCILFTLAFGRLGTVAPLVNQRLALAGGLVLTSIGLYTLWGAWRQSQSGLAAPGEPPAPSKTAPATKGYLTGLVMTAVNPMNLAFWASLGAGTGLFQLHGMGDRLFLAAGVMLGALSWVVAFSAFLHHTRHRISDRLRHWVTALGGLGIVFFGIRMLISM